jgi:hypothetical protein
LSKLAKYVIVFFINERVIERITYMGKLENFKKKELKKLSKKCSKAYEKAYKKRVMLENYIKETNPKISDEWLNDKIEVNLVHEHTTKDFVKEALDIIGLKKKKKNKKDDNKAKNNSQNKDNKKNKETKEEG